MSAQVPASQFLPTLHRSAASVFAPVQRELDRIFDQLGAGWVSLSDVELSPRMDLVEDKDSVELTLEVPGMSVSDIKIAVDGDLLTVSGEKKHEADTKDRNRRVVERSYGAFRRSVSLPNVDVAKIQATMADGVLKITAPKQAGPEAKQIEIQSPK